ncbi:MAG TPA: methyltransferase [Candidatus Angelobacter sp.]|nr:methyltransferase [Candidatus Angelobacter sp.]
MAKISLIGFTETTVRERLGLHDLSDLHWRNVPIYRAERLLKRDPLDLAIELFLLQGTLSKDELDRLFVASEQEVLLRAEVLAVDEKGNGRARASLFPVGERLIFSDHAWPELPHPGYTTVPYDHVMYIGADSRELARCTFRKPFRSALDLCTGSGIHAVLASAHSERVIAVDINERAARCTRFNAQLFGATNLEARVGDLLEPVKDEQFDLITANPPFVPSPVHSLAFRDGGRSGEDVQKRIVAGLPHHLAPGGIAQITTELGEREGEPLTLRLREWLGGAAMDIHILRLREYSAAKYAIAHAKGDDYKTFLESVDAWAGNLRDQGYVRVVAVLISIQWSNPALGPSWDRTEECPPPQRAAWREIEAAFRAERLARKPDLHEFLQQNWVQRTGPIALLDAQALGSTIPANAKATLLGQALPIEHQLDSLEREILKRLEIRTAVPELIKTFQKFNVSEERTLAAIVSLLRHRLITTGI